MEDTNYEPGAIQFSHGEGADFSAVMFIVDNDDMKIREGGLLGSQMSVSAEQARELADWIIEHFGEKPSGRQAKLNEWYDEGLLDENNSENQG